MVLRLRGAEDDNTANKQKIIDLLVETRSLEEKVCGYERERSAYDKKIKYFQDEISEQKKDFTDVLSRLSKAERSNSVYESEEKRRNEEQKKTEAEGIKNKHVETLNHEEKLKNDIEKELLEEEKKRNLREKENMANDFHRVSNENLSHVLSTKLLHSQVGALQQELFDIKKAFSNFKTEKSRMEEEDVEEMKKISMVKKEEMKEKAESNEQIMRQEMIMREEKENWYSVEISLRNEIENLKRILQETQTQSLRDQGQDAAALQEMNRKFENLMVNYEINVTAVNEKIDSNNSHLQYSDGILVSQKQTIKLLEEKLQQKSGMLQSCSQDLLIECTLKNEEIHRNRTLIEIIVKMKESFQHELRVLNNDLMETRQGVESLVLFFHEEAARLGATFKDVIQGFLEEVSRTHETKVRTIKSALISNHENKMQILESSLTHRIDTLIGEHSEKLNHLQSLSDSQVTTVLNIDDQSMERDDYPRDQSTRNVYGSMIDQSTRNVHSNMIDQSTFEVEESHGSLSASIFSDESPLPAYESVMKGLLAALELSGLLSSSEIQELVSLAAENKEPSLIASSSAQMLLADYLNRLLVDIKESKSEIRHLQKELNFEIHESQLEKDNNALLRERINFSSNPADLSVINSETFSSKAFDIAVEELEQSRNEQSLLLGTVRCKSAPHLVLNLTSAFLLLCTIAIHIGDNYFLFVLNQSCS